MTTVNEAKVALDDAAARAVSGRGSGCAWDMPPPPGVVLLWLFPVYWVVLTSFKPIVEINSAIPSFVFEPTLENYRDLIAKFEFSGVLLNSIIVTVATCIVVVGLGVMAAYALARMNVPGEKHLALWILSLRFLPPIAVAIPFYIQWQDLNLLDTHVGLIVVYVAFNLPFAIWLLRGFLADVPIELEEAALSTASRACRFCGGSSCP